MDVRTGTEKASKETANLEENLSFMRTFLLVFAYVSLFVGAFIIFNTFSITVAQRTREFGLLRTLGASRAQVLRSVIFEGVLLGVLGSLLGLLGGILLAPALDQLFKAFGADLPDSGTVLETRTIVVSLLVGMTVTVLSGLVPAVRATRIPPLAAMREGVGIPPRPLPTRRQLIARFAAALVIVHRDRALIFGHGLGLVLFIGAAIAFHEADGAVASRRASARRSATASSPRSPARSACSSPGAGSPGGSRARTRCASRGARW